MTTTDHRRHAEELLANADRDVSANWPTMTGEQKSDILAAAQVHATLALVRALTPAERAAPAKPTGWVYRITVDKYPTPDGRPFTDQSVMFWADIIERHLNNGADDNPDWVPANLEEWLYLDTGDQYQRFVEPDRIGRTIIDDTRMPMLNVPVARRRHWLSASTARSIVAGLREWGAEVRLERCPLESWEEVA